MHANSERLVKEAKNAKPLKSNRRLSLQLLIGALLLTSFATQDVPVYAKKDGDKQGQAEWAQQQQEKAQRKTQNDFARQQMDQQRKQAEKQMRKQVENNFARQQMDQQRKQAEKQMRKQSENDWARKQADEDRKRAEKEARKQQGNDWARKQAEQNRKHDDKQARWQNDNGWSRKQAEEERKRLEKEARRKHGDDWRKQQERDRKQSEKAARDAQKQAERNRDRATDFNRSQNQANRWDYKMDNRQRYHAYKKYRNNWNDQRSYLKNNIKYFNQMARLNQIQQQQMDNEMRTAWLAYHNNRWNGPYGWSNYSDPNFLDYLQTRQPSLLQRILSAIGLGQGDDYLYSSNWNDERSQLSRNMANIHQLALEGRITPQQEQALMRQMQAQFMAYHNNQWSGPMTWSQYSDPGFVDYLRNQRPSILTEVRDFLIR